MAIKLYEDIDKAIYNYASCYDSPDTSENEEFSDALVDVIDLIRESSIGELELKEDCSIHSSLPSTEASFLNSSSVSIPIATQLSSPAQRYTP